MIRKQFLHAIAWNTISVFLYKVLLQTHQACLFYVISKELFGISGTIFSSIYLLISLTNFGFDYSLFSFYARSCISKQQFSFLIKQYALRLATIIIVATLCVALILCPPTLLGIKAFIEKLSIGLQSISSEAYSNKINQSKAQLYLLSLFVSIFITESIKRSLETLAQLSFLNKSITILEISTIVAYLSSVWCGYCLFGYINLYIIFIPMAIASFIEVILLFFRLHTFYVSLPDLHEATFPGNNTNMSHKSISYNQAINYFNQVAKALFSPNFFILILAYHLGFIKAGYIKLFTDTVILLYMLLNRSVGIPSGALLVRLSSNTHIKDMKDSFLSVTNTYIQFLYLLAATLVASLGPCILISSCSQPVLTINIVIFTIAGFFEYLVITYEKLYLTQHASSILARINIVSVILLAITIPILSALPQSLLLLPIAAIRATTVIVIAIVAYKNWGLLPSFAMHKITAAITLAILAAGIIWHYTT